jgi:hypothetical protein
VARLSVPIRFGNEEDVAKRARELLDQDYHSVDGGDNVYEAQEVARKAPHVEVNSSIEYSVSKDYLQVRDSDGKMHKLALVKTTRKQ